MAQRCLLAWVASVSMMNGVEAHTIAAIPFEPSPIPAENLRTLVERIRLAAARGATVIVLPEHAIEGPLGDMGHDRRLWEMSSSQAVRRISLLAKELRVYIVLNVPERMGKQSFTTARLFSPGSHTVLRQHKVRLQSGVDDSSAVSGDAGDIGTVSIGRERLGIASGNDFQLVLPRLAELGADTVAVSAAWAKTEFQEKLVDVRRAARLYSVNIAVANLWSCSAIVSRDGSFVGQQRPDSECSLGEPIVAEVPSLGRAMPLGLPADPAPRSSLPTAEAIADGEQIFHDAALSSDRLTSCATCHNPAKAFADGRPLAVGVFGRRGTRNTKALLNAQFSQVYGWEGPDTRLESKVMHPFGAWAEMETPVEDALARLRRSVPSRANWTAREMSSALAAYVRTLYAANSPFDRYRYQADLDALEPSARRGLQLFAGKAGCSECHRNTQYDALFTDGKRRGSGHGDPLSASQSPRLFITPGLRNVALTAPYMHDGRFSSLEQVIDSYGRGGRAGSHADGRAQPPRLNPAERADLVEFLRSLTAEPLLRQISAHDRSQVQR